MRLTGELVTPARDVKATTEYLISKLKANSARSCLRLTRADWLEQDHPQWRHSQLDTLVEPMR